MKLKNTLCLHISSMHHIREDRPVIELHRGDTSQPWMIAVHIVVGGFAVGIIVLDRFETSNGMLALKHRETYGQYSGHRSLTSDCLPKLVRTDVDSWIFDSCGFEPKEYQLPFVNVGTVGHCDFGGGFRRGDLMNLHAHLRPTGLICAGTPANKSVLHEDRKTLAEMFAKFEFRVPKDRDLNTKKYYFDPSAGLNPHLEQGN